MYICFEPKKQNTMPKLKDYSYLIGTKFGRLTVIDVIHITRKAKRAKVVCDCGVEKEVSVYSLLIGDTVSCKCYSKEFHKRNNSKHGLSGNPLYFVWHNMLNRCYSEKHESYKDYGGRGITVCDEWKNDISEFVKWATDSGWKKELEVDRKDNDKGYSPDNCRLVTPSENKLNRRVTKYVEYNGERICRFLLLKEKGMCATTFEARIKKGMSVEEAIETPIATHRNRNSLGRWA